LFKIIGLNDKSSASREILSSSAVLAEAIRLAARGNQILLIASEDQNLTPDLAEKRLDQALDNLYSAADRLQEAKVGLAEVKWEEVPQTVLPSQGFLEKTAVSMQEQVDQLITTIETSLDERKSLNSDLTP
jgi:hypothetical protein